jgi:hypothetical protein
MSSTARIVAVSVVAAGLFAAAACRWTASRTPSHPNLLLITIDTLRADHVARCGA